MSANKQADRSERAGAYDHPLYYDIINTPGTAEDVTVLRRIARKFQGAGARPVWVEPGCGSGRYVRGLARRGEACVGIDLDAGMVEFARGDLARLGLARRARVVKGDMRRMDGAPIRRAVKEVGGRAPVAAFCLHNSVRHLGSDRALVEHLRSMGRLLGERGVYIVGIGLSGRGGESACETVYTARRGGLLVREVIDFMPPELGDESRREDAYRVLTVKRERTGEETQIVSHYTLRTYTLEEWRGGVARAGLVEAAVLGSWGDVLPMSRRRYALRILRVAK